MSSKCKTCPFNVDENGRHVDEKMVSRIQVQVITEAGQICHHPRLHNKPETHLCRGAYDFQQEILSRLQGLKNV
jgi:hypothetical protein